MKISLITSVMLSLSVVASGNALAQNASHDDSYGISRNHLEQKQNDRYNNASRRGHVDNRTVARYQRSDYTQQYHSDAARAGAHTYDSRREQRLSRQYQDNRHVTTGKTVHHSSPPVRGRF